LFGAGGGRKGFSCGAVLRLTIGDDDTGGVKKGVKLLV
jgi:hypothetical protein